MKTNTEIINTLTKVYETGVHFERFRSCQAWISEPIFNSAYNITFRLIKSYNTIVGFINLDNGEYIELGKWSVTTSKQVTQIYNSMFSTFERILLK